MAGAETAGDEGFRLKNRRLWLAFTISFLFVSRLCLVFLSISGGRRGLFLVLKKV